MIANDEIREVKYKTTFGGWIKKTYRGKTLISEEPILPPVKETYSNYSSKNKYSNSDIKINENSQQAVFKNISSQSYQSYSSTNISSGGGGGVGATSAYISDLKDEKNENQKAVELLFNDGLKLKDGHLLSPKDRDVSEYLERLIKSGVKSLKIEGRMRDANYVRSAVYCYRRMIDAYYEGNLNSDLLKEISDILPEHHIFIREI